MKQEVDNKELVNKIQEHLWVSSKWFINELHEENYFNKDKYDELLSFLKLLKVNLSDEVQLSEKLYKIFFQKLTYMYDVLIDLYEHKNEFNLSKKEYYNSILEIKYEFLSLMSSDITTDYHWFNYE